MTKQKIAIIGGGIGGLTAAYELTDPKLQNKYDITCLLYTSPSPRDLSTSRMPSSA